MSLFSSISGFISNAIVGGDSPVHLPSAPAPLADVMSTASAMTTAFFSDNKPQQQQQPPAAAKPPPSPTPAAQPPPSSITTPAGSRDRGSTSSAQSRTPSASSLSESLPMASKSATPGRPSMPPPPPHQPGKMAMNDGPDLGPEFSHLSAEERRQIQMVMARAAQMTDDRQPKGYESDEYSENIRVSCILYITLTVHLKQRSRLLKGMKISLNLNFNCHACIYIVVVQ